MRTMAIKIWAIAVLCIICSCYSVNSFAQTGNSNIDEPGVTNNKDMPQAELQKQTGPAGELYVDERIGFEITAPKGWVKRVDRRGNVIFSKEAASDQIVFPYPSLGVVIDALPPDMNSALLFSTAAMSHYEAGALKNNIAFNLVEFPHEIEINGIKGARFIFEMSSPGKAMKSIDCKFMKDGVIISLQGMDHPGDFGSSLKDFEETIKSFKFNK